MSNFDPTKYGKEEFDPTSYGKEEPVLAPKEQKSEHTFIENLNSARANFGQSAPFIGAADKLAAAGEAVGQEVGDLFRDKKDQRDFSDRYNESVKFYHDEREDSAKKGSKAAQLTGTAAGIGANLAIPTPGSKAKGIMALLSRVAGSAGMAGTEAATANPNKLIDLTAAEKAAKTGALYAGGSEVLGGLKTGYDALTKATQKAADKTAWRALVGQNKALAGQVGDVATAGARAREMGLVAAGDTPDTIRAKLVTMMRTAGKKRGEVADRVDDTLRQMNANKAVVEARKAHNIPENLDDMSEEAAEKVSEFLDKVRSDAMRQDPKIISGGEVGAFIRQQADNKIPTIERTVEKPSAIVDEFGNPFTKTVTEYDILPGQKNVSTAAEREAKFYEDAGDLTFKKAQALKGGYKFKAMDQSTHIVPQDVQNAAKSGIGKVQEEAIGRAEKQLPKELKGVAKDFAKANGEYGFLAGLSKGVKNHAAALDSNTLTGLFGPMAAGAMATGGDLSPTSLARGLAGAALYRQGKLRGASTGQAALNQVARVMRGGGKFADILAKANARGSAAFMATHQVLLRDPEYRALLEKEDSSDDAP